MHFTTPLTSTHFHNKVLSDGAFIFYVEHTSCCINPYYRGGGFCE